jgi:hypothetical protein
MWGTKTWSLGRHFESTIQDKWYKNYNRSSLPMVQSSRKQIVPQLAKKFRWPSWLRHCSTSRKVAGSIPDVIEIFH